MLYVWRIWKLGIMKSVVLKFSYPHMFQKWVILKGFYIYLLTPWSIILLEKLTGFAANQEIPRILWNPKAHYRTHLSLSWANSIQSPQPLPTSWRFILILSSHLRLGLSTGLFPSGFPTKTLCTPLPSSIRTTSHSSWSLSSSLCNFLHSPVTPSLLGPNILLNTLFSNTLSLCSSLNVNIYHI